MPFEYGTLVSSVVDVSSSEVDIVSATEYWTEEATVFVKNGVGTATLRFYGKAHRDSRIDWAQIGDDITQEPSTTKIYTVPDMFGSIKVRAVRYGSNDTTIETYVIWQPVEKRQVPARPNKAA